MYAEWFAIVLMTRGRGVDVGSVVCLLARTGAPRGATRTRAERRERGNDQGPMANKIPRVQ
jgi:hypothetical protein